VKIQIKLEGIDELEKAFDPKIVKKALRRTMGETGRKFKANITKDVRKTYAVKAKELKSHIVGKTINDGDGLRYEFTVKGRTINLIHFGARQLKRGGVSVLVRRDHGRKRIRSAFIAPDRGGRLRVFMRKGESRLPIEAKNTLSVPQMFNDEIVKKNLELVESGWRERLSHNLDYYLGKL